jgi:hypothetical protein
MWMWLCRATMLWCAFIGIWGAATSDTFMMISGWAGLPMNAFSAEFSRRLAARS